MKNTPEASLGRKAASGVAIALAALAMSPEQSSANPEAVIPPQRPEVLTRSDQRLAALGVKLENLAKRHAPLTFRDTVTKDGKKTERLTISHRSKDFATSQYSYEQVVLERPIGDTKFNLAYLILGSATARYSDNEQLDSYSAMAIAHQNPNMYLLLTYDPHQDEYLYLQKRGMENTGWIVHSDNTSTKHVPVGEAETEQAFDNFTSTIAELGKP